VAGVQYWASRAARAASACSVSASYCAEAAAVMDEMPCLKPAALCCMADSRPPLAAPMPLAAPVGFRILVTASAGIEECDVYPYRATLVPRQGGRPAGGGLSNAPWTAAWRASVPAAAVVVACICARAAEPHSARHSSRRTPDRAILEGSGRVKSAKRCRSAGDGDRSGE